MTHYFSYDESRHSASQRLPKFLFDYIDGAAHSESTKTFNTSFYDRIKLYPRNGILTSPPDDFSVDFLGSKHLFPFYLSPVGSTRLYYPNAEVCAAICAQHFQVPYCLSSFSGTSLHTLRQLCPELQLWFQLYQIGDIETTARMLQNAQDAGVSTLVVTIDTPVPGYRVRDLRNNLDQISRMTFSSIFNSSVEFIPKLSWYLDYFRDGLFKVFPNILTESGPLQYSDASSLLKKTRFNWSDLKVIRKLWHGPIIIKGVQSVHDAKQCIDSGCSSFIISNHGGRQLESLTPTVSLLMDIKQHIPAEFPIAIDGGIQNSIHIVKALALGASIVGLGRSYIWPLAASGQEGLMSYLSHLTADLCCTMDLLGCPSISDLDKSYLSLVYAP